MVGRMEDLVEETIALIKDKVSALIRFVKSVVDSQALVLGKEFSGYLMPEIYDPLIGYVAMYTIIEFDTEQVTVIASPIQVPTIQDVYGNYVRIAVIDPRDRVELGVKRFTDDVSALSNILSNYKIVAYAGSVPVSDLGDLLFVNVDQLVKRMRMIKLDEEISRIEKAVRIAEEAIKEVLSEICSGISELNIAKELNRVALSKGGEGLAFPTIVAVGRSSREPHHITSRNIRFEGREPVLIDFGVRYKGYCSDITRMLIPKNLDRRYENVLKVCDVVSEVIDISLKELRSGIEGSKLYEIACNEMRSRGDYDKWFIHGLGHGIGVDVHEEPYLSRKWRKVIPERAVVTIEPGVYLKEFGVRIEEDVLVTMSGATKITRIDRVIELW